MAASKSNSSKSRRRLGRGLHSLLTDPAEVPIRSKTEHQEGGPDTDDPSADSSDAPAPSAGSEAGESGQATETRADAALEPEPTVAPSRLSDAGGPKSAMIRPPAASSRSLDRSAGPPAASPRHAASPQGPTAGSTTADFAPQDHGGHPAIRTVALEALTPNPHQPRRDFDEESIASLAESIRTAGLMQPIVVRPVGATSGGAPRFEIVAGERRFRAAARVPLESVPVIVRDVDDRMAAELALVENLQREDLNPIERAHAFRRLADEFGMTHEAIADAVGLDRASISNHLRLLGLDESTLGDVRAGRLGMGHGRALLAITTLAPRRSLAEQAIRDGWSVRELERRIRSFLRREQEDAASADDEGSPDLSRSHLDDLERRLGEHLGTRVRVRPGRKKGTGEVRIEFFSHEEFEGLLSRVGFSLP